MGNIIIGLVLGSVIGVVALYLFMPQLAMKKIDSFLTRWKSSNETIREYLSNNLSETEAERFINELKKSLSAQICLRISERSVGGSVANKLVEHVNTKLSSVQTDSKQSQGFIDRKKEKLKNKIKNHAESVIDNNKNLIEQVLSNKINDVIIREGRAIVTEIVNQEIDNFLSSPVSSLFSGNENMISELKRLLSTILFGKRWFSHKNLHPNTQTI